MEVSSLQGCSFWMSGLVYDRLSQVYFIFIFYFYFLSDLFSILKKLGLGFSMTCHCYKQLHDTIVEGSGRNDVIQHI